MQQPNNGLRKIKDKSNLTRFTEECDLSELLDFAQRQAPEENVWCLQRIQRWAVGIPNDMEDFVEHPAT